MYKDCIRRSACDRGSGRSRDVVRAIKTKIQIQPQGEDREKEAS